MKLNEIQKETKEWTDYNFPNTPSYRPLLGVVEEVGELCHAHLKNEQGIRGTPEQWEAAKKDAVGDILVYLLDYCSRENLNIEECLELAWSEVKVRDWVKFPKNGRTE